MKKNKMKKKKKKITTIYQSKLRVALCGLQSFSPHVVVVVVFVVMGWTIKKCKFSFSASSRLPTIEIFLQWKSETKYYL